MQLGLSRSTLEYFADYGMCGGCAGCLGSGQWSVGIDIRLIERFAAVTESIGWSILLCRKKHARV